MHIPPLPLLIADLLLNSQNVAISEKFTKTPTFVGAQIYYRFTTDLSETLKLLKTGIRPEIYEKLGSTIFLRIFIDSLCNPPFVNKFR